MIQWLFDTTLVGPPILYSWLHLRKISQRRMGSNGSNWWNAFYWGWNVGQHIDNIPSWQNFVLFSFLFIYFNIFWGGRPEARPKGTLLMARATPPRGGPPSTQSLISAQNGEQNQPTKYLPLSQTSTPPGSPVLSLQSWYRLYPLGASSCTILKTQARVNWPKTTSFSHLQEEIGFYQSKDELATWIFCIVCPKVPSISKKASKKVIQSITKVRASSSFISICW